MPSTATRDPTGSPITYVRRKENLQELDEVIGTGHTLADDLGG